MGPGREPLPTRVEDTPPLEPAYERALDEGLASLGIRVDAPARIAIDGHVRLLLAWNSAINLTAIRDPDRVAVGHVLDALSALPLLRRNGIERFVDLGSGGGYPGLPLAAALPAHHALLVDSVGKKVRFLAAAIAATGLGGTVEAYSGRAESLAAEAAQRGAWPAVTARAVAPLAELVELSFPLLEPGGILVAWKRGALEEELDAAGRAMAGLGGGTLELADAGTPLLAGHRLVVARSVGSIPARFPRDPAQRRRAPW
ncbi:MAG TPA: 16S rRNA (guanine(527)-N(7))-methyltransferase RsmG [Clostridia bacterium]|nr:16S rRNA (guanine(527)-N(7))-methyltransferase RsmG [Clostridia bacterium]